MDRHFLVAVSEDKSALYGARFAASFFTNKKDVRLTLFYTAARPFQAAGEMPSFRERAEIDRQYKEREKTGRTAIENAKKLLIDEGFPAAQIDDKLKFRKYSKSVDIIDEGVKGLYDAVILGGRGLSWLEKFAENSVTEEILRIRCDFPIWICRRPERKLKNVLICVDDSEPSMRMVDHAGFVMAGEPSHRLTLLNVYDPGSGDRVFAEEIFLEAKKSLLSNGVGLERIRTRVIEDYNPARAILREAEKGEYAAVAVGRTGEDRGFITRLFMGSVSTTLFKNLSGPALWLSH